jgi:hypothetical protein
MAVNNMADVGAVNGQTTQVICFDIAVESAVVHFYPINKAEAEIINHPLPVWAVRNVLMPYAISSNVLATSPRRTRRNRQNPQNKQDSFREERLSDANQFAAALADIQRVNSFECLDNDPIAWNAPQFGVILQHIRSTYRRRAKRRHD